MNFAFQNNSISGDLPRLAETLISLMENQGDRKVSFDRNPDFIINLVDLASPKAFIRSSEEEKVVSVAFCPDPVKDLRSACFKALVKSLSNMFFCIFRLEGDPALKACYTTPEAGFVVFDFNPDTFCTCMEPVIRSRFVLRNRMIARDDIPQDEQVQSVNEIASFARILDGMGILPAPFPLREVLSDELIGLLYRLYKIKGLSYGNMSIRRKNTESSYWMTARGVDKANLRAFGKDILLVEGFDPGTWEMVVAVPPEHDPTARVSVDAIEHYMIYKNFPRVGAIVHVHGWIDGVMSTVQNYPCGTFELAENVVSLLKTTADPASAEVGLKNHGLTITGPDLDSIFIRINGRLKTEVPMIL